MAQRGRKNFNWVENPGAMVVAAGMVAAGRSRLDAAKELARSYPGLTVRRAHKYLRKHLAGEDAWAAYRRWKANLHTSEKRGDAMREVWGKRGAEEREAHARAMRAGKRHRRGRR